MVAKRDYYDILGVSRNASEQEIKKAYRKKALEWHPDRHKQDKGTAERRFKEINEAYEVLSDSQKRQTYDQFGHAAFTPGGQPPPGGFAGFQGFPGGFTRTGRYGPFTYTYTTYGAGKSSPFEGFDFSDPFEIFEQIFGTASPFGRRAQIPRVGLTIDFMDAVRGTEREIEVGGEKRKVKIPPGVDDGSRIRFSDFYVTVDVRSHDTFAREGDDIFVDVSIPFTLAALGGEIKAPTVDGEVKLRIRAGTQPGTLIRLRGQGMPRLRARGRGDQYVRVNVEVPEKLTPKQRQLLEKFKRGS